MEKVIAALWAAPDQNRPGFNAQLVQSLPAALRAAGASKVRLNLRDVAVEPAHRLIQQWQAPQQDAVVQFWVPSANAIFRTAIDAALSAHSGRFAAWLVAESTIIPNHAHPMPTGTRGWGWSQASFITFRPDLTRIEAIKAWHSHHTRVAIDTQANFEYVQNLIVRPLTQDAPAYDAFVEECFPAEAMDDPAAFFDAAGDPAKLQANLATMMDSCSRFIDFTRIDIIPTSQYDC
ncbi:EthD domain-containing protein [Novosphingobium sp.]|uniref:EthD domain-containing protein n=1 Tax=Novosphingobium sp. TaxID=1874826 RepID=UPI0027374799|nr:EthD domain-containing protein [Novosphingobium sp.]MDP3907349.1 EthD domain-containing protein [Novosphingobium sp.]